MLTKKNKENDSDLLSLKALKWLKSPEVDYRNRSHEDRIALIKAAKILFPED